MNILNINLLNLKKLRAQRGKALFLILPIFILLTITVVVLSQVQNFKSALDQVVFNTLENQATIIRIKRKSQNSPYQGGFSGGPGSFQQENMDNNFSQTDVEVVSAITGVESASLNSEVPISNISTSDLFEEVTLDLGTLSEFDSNAASIYSVEDFTYTEGKEIPIILNSNSFATTYEDWGGETEIVMDFQELRRDRQAGPPDPQEEEANNPFPIKTKSIEYSRSDLLGKTITIEFGGLDSINTYTIEQEDGVRKFVKLTDEEVQALLTERQSVISEYWNYEKISTPLTYTFKVVGIIDEGNASYIPSNFANKVMSDYIDNQLGALQKDITDDLLDSTFLGLSYDGTEFSSTSGFGLGREMPGGGMGMGRPQEISSTEDSYNIPGLVIKTASDGSSDVEGMVTDKAAYSTAVKSSPSIPMKIDSI